MQELNQLQPRAVLEVGSGPEGLRMFWKGLVFGADLAFPRSPIHLGVRTSGCTLPFTAGQFPVVVSLDMLEHVSPGQRRELVQELARVTSGVLLLGFPSGEAAAHIYRSLAASHQNRRLIFKTGNRWITDHIELGLPDAGEVCNWLSQAGFTVTPIWYEPVSLHLRVMRLEMIEAVRILTYLVMRLAGQQLIQRLPEARDGAMLRVLIRAERNLGETKQSPGQR